jgi:hypothetical protein
MKGAASAAELMVLAPSDPSIFTAQNNPSFGAPAVTDKPVGRHVFKRESIEILRTHWAGASSVGLVMDALANAGYHGLTKRQITDAAKRYAT